ncbi:MAG: amino acid adenylation domain-containing protein, partial [Gemmatimonadetes bacterium]|nr:amino acid adenylation domain-containing protein [Gemmatimonadota bacterium]
VHETTARFRLSPQQRRVWSLQAAEARGVYNATGVVAIGGALDVDALARAVEHVAAGNEILRTVFRCLPGTRVPVQGIVETLPPAWRVLDWSDAADGDERERVDALLAELDETPLSYEEGPLFHAALAALAPDRHLLVLRVHALCADAVSLRNLTAEVAAAYGALAGGGEAAAPEIQYADVSEVFNDLLESEETQAGRDYWAEVPRAAASDYELPHQRREREAGDFAPRMVERVLDADATARVRALAEGAETTPAAVLLTAWQLLLARLTGQDEVEVGVAFDGRVYEGLDVALGAFVRYLPTRAAADPAGTFADAVRAVGATLAERYEWQDYLDPASGSAAGEEAAHSAFGFDWDERPAPGTFAGAEFAVVGIAARSERFGARLSCVDEGDTIRLVLEHDEHLIAAQHVERTADRLLVLLADALRRPEAPMAELELLPDAELRYLLLLGRSADEVRADRCVHAVFEAQAALVPERPAVVFGDRSLTYAELNERANRLAHLLRGLGVRPETAVGLCVERGVETLVGLLGILKAGGVHVPLDPMYPAERIAYMAGEAGVELFVTQAAIRDRGLLPAGRTVSLDADRERIDAMPAANPDNGVVPENAAYVIYTSGSTGRPKGVVVSHGAATNLSAALEAAVYRGKQALKVSMNAPLVFDGSVKQWIQLLRGHTLHLIPEADRMSPERLLGTIRRTGLDVLDCTPTQLKGLLASGLGDGPHHVPGMILSGGEALDPITWSRLAALPDTESWNVYGPTEFTVDATAGQVAEHPERPTIGRPIPSTSAYLLHDGFRPAPLGVAGEVCLSGPRVARGYLGDPVRTAEKFVPDPFGGHGTAGARMYRTGDLARFAEDGALEYLGRGDDQVKVRGVRIELGEIEALLREHPAVAAAVAAVREEDGESQLVAYFVARSGADSDPAALQQALRDSLRARLPEFMVPAMVVPIAEVPTTRSGKTDRRALPDPRELQAKQRAAYVEPGSEIEGTIARIWQEVLGVERIGIHDNFFDLGGNSLLVVQAYDRMTEALGEKLTLVELFQYPTVTLLAQRLGAGVEEPSVALKQAEDRGARQREAMRRGRRPNGPRG